MAEQVAQRLRSHGMRGATVQIKVRYADFHTITRAHSLRTPTNATREIWEAASELLANRLPARPLRIRLLGVGVSGLEAGGQPQKTLFEDEQRQSQSRLDETVDGIRERFGRERLNRGSDLGRMP